MQDGDVERAVLRWHRFMEAYESLMWSLDYGDALLLQNIERRLTEHENIWGHDHGGEG